MSMNFILNKVRALRSYIYWGKELLHLNGKCAYFLGIPTHSNIGDSAIVLAEKIFLKSCGYDRIVEITSQEYVSYRKCIKRLLPKHATIFLPGGGNMGDLWPVEEERRCQIIEDFRDHPITVFPQTIYYGASQEDTSLKERTIQVYNSANNMAIVAREKVSYDIMKTLYPKCKILLTPDIVLSMGYQKFSQNRYGILLCFRNDKEKNIASVKKESLIFDLQKEGYSLFTTDTLSDGQILEINRKETVTEKMRQIASARLLITDRLHGMIFAAITGTPCIVLGNNHHKVSGTYDWLRELEYISFVSDCEIAKKKVSELYHMKRCVFEIDDSVFEKLKDYIIQNLS